MDRGIGYNGVHKKPYGIVVRGDSDRLKALVPSLLVTLRSGISGGGGRGRGSRMGAGKEVAKVRDANTKEIEVMTIPCSGLFRSTVLKEAVRRYGESKEEEVDWELIRLVNRLPKHPRPPRNAITISELVLNAAGELQSFLYPLTRFHGRPLNHHYMHVFREMKEVICRKVKKKKDEMKARIRLLRNNIGNEDDWNMYVDLKRGLKHLQVQ